MTANLLVNGAGTNLGVIYDYSWFDTSFDRLYNRFEWVNDRTFRVTGDPEPNEHDHVLVTNSSGRQLEYAVIQVSDLLLVFGLPNGSTLNNVVVPENTDLPFLSVRAKVEGASELRKSINFDTYDGTGRLHRFEVRITTDDIKLTMSFLKNAERTF